LEVWIQRFLKHSSTLRNKAFFYSLAHISGKSYLIAMDDTLWREKKRGKG